MKQAHLVGTIRNLIASVAILAASSEMAASEKTGKANRLLNEPSPYLQQHAYNPVDWYPWSEEAFAKARKENKPILLSVGYATCHWCHVMDRESYSDPAIAKILNNGFVAIKVDRERRPEIDEIYMLATHLLTEQSGGWPNNVVLTPRLMPFFAGTYFPRDNFEDLLQQISLQWAVNNEAIRQEGHRVAGLIDRIMRHRTAAENITPDVVETAVLSATKDFDLIYGGIGSSAKFPRESLLLFLLDQAEKNGNETALEIVTKTLDSMVWGGLHDHVGGGFHRYTVDQKWIVPHFEKMLYNQAGIGRALIQAHRITGNQRYEDAARRLFDFVLRDMKSETGGFYAAFDADSTGSGNVVEEGLFYVWTLDDLKTALGDEDAAFAIRIFGATKAGNFEGRNVVHLVRDLDDIAKYESIDRAKLMQRLAGLFDRLRDYREKNRKPPHRDDKVLTAWNGAMITALAEAGLSLGAQRYLDAAKRAGTFFWKDMGGEKSALMRQHYEGKASLEATQQGYALLALGFLSLYDATNEIAWLDRSKALAIAMNEKFLDKSTNDYFMTVAGSDFYRPKINADGDLPSGSAAAVDLFSRLARRDLDPNHRTTAEAVMVAISGNAVAQPESYAYSLRAIDQLLRGETGRKHYLAKGRVHATAEIMPDSASVRVLIRVVDGWHVNANKPLEDAFIPTVIEAIGNDEASTIVITYPAPVKRKLGFHDEILALYEGEVEVTVKAASADKMPKKLALRVQACSDKICLEPETVTLPVVTN